MTAFAPIAVVGMAARFPGVAGPAALWADVRAGRDWVAEGCLALDGDPTLEVAFEALQDAGGRPAGRGACVLGALLLPDTALVERVAAEGVVAPPDPAAGLAAALGIPVVVLDTACASSAFAIARACDMLHAGEADWVLAGAVSKADPVLLQQSLGAVGVLSPSGRCRPFQAEADGYVLSEGVAWVVLRPLADGDRDHAVISGAAATNAGRTKSLLAPSERAQGEAIERALAQAGLGPDDLGYVEAQGTGGALADLVELRALRRAFGKRETPLPIGSLRATLGHATAASGLASLIVLIQALRDGVLPPLGPGEPIPHVARMGCRLVGTPAPWAGPRRAGLNAFAFGGHHAHVIVEAPPAAAAPFVPTPGSGAIVEVARGRSTEPGSPQERLLAAARAAMAGVAVDGVAGLIAAAGIVPADVGSVLAERRGEAHGLDAEAFVGRLTTLVAGRVAHELDLRAASYVVSDVGAARAIAERMLRSGEADLMLVGEGAEVVVLGLSRSTHPRLPAPPPVEGGGSDLLLASEELPPPSTGGGGR